MAHDLTWPNINISSSLEAVKTEAIICQGRSDF